LATSFLEHLVFAINLITLGNIFWVKVHGVLRLKPLTTSNEVTAIVSTLKKQVLQLFGVHDVEVWNLKKMLYFASNVKDVL